MRKFATFVVLCLALAGAGACSSSGAPRSVQGQALVDQSKATVELFKSRAKDSTPLFRAALRDAKGVLIFPDVFQFAIGIGGMGGDGVMLTRMSDGAWGYPAFFSLGGGSLGVGRREPVPSLDPRSHAAWAALGLGPDDLDGVLEMATAVLKETEGVFG